ncbi:hypothetical protein ACFL60_08420, partial [Candidatus Omnitrophota bacterium]
ILLGQDYIETDNNSVELYCDGDVTGLFPHIASQTHPLVPSLAKRGEAPRSLILMSSVTARGEFWLKRWTTLK